MKTIKWLWALVIGMFTVICFAFLSSIFVKVDDIYLALNKPVFIPEPTVIALIWGLVYLFLAYTIAGLVVKKAKIIDYVLIAVYEVINTAFTLFFFYFHNLSVCLGLAFLQFGLCLYMETRYLKTDKKIAFAFLFVLLWISFLTVNSYITVMIN